MRMVEMHQMRDEKSGELLGMYKKAYEQSKTNSKLLKKKVKEGEERQNKLKEEMEEQKKRAEEME